MAREPQHGKSKLATIEKCPCDLCEAYRERKQGYQRRWREANRDQIRRSKRRYRAANPEQDREKSRRYHEMNRERSRGLSRQWKTANPDRVREIDRETQRRRRARKAGVISEPYTLAEIAEMDHYVCGLCDLPVDMTISGREPMGPTVDHIIPISWGGPDTPANVHLAHRRCNITKGHRVDPDRAIYWLCGIDLPRKADLTALYEGCSA